TTPMHVFITGASGLIGARLVSLLEESGHQVTRLTRNAPSTQSERQWNPQSETLDPSLLEGCDALVHLAGESIASGRWTAAKKQRIRDSRVHSTELLSRTIAAMSIKPRAFVVASAI